MSRVLKIDRKFYNGDGVVPLYRGDDWSFSGLVVDVVNGYETPVDLTNYAATGFFPLLPPLPPCSCFRRNCFRCYPVCNQPQTLPASASGTSCGVMTVSLPAASTPLVGDLIDQDAYVILADQSGALQTVPCRGPIRILNRGFTSDY